MEYRIKESLLKGAKISYACRECGSELESKLEEAGTKDTCPVCGQGFVVPGADELKRRQDKQKKKEADKRQLQEHKQRLREEKPGAPSSPSVRVAHLLWRWGTR